MYRFFRKNREAVKKYLLVVVLGIVSLGMVVMFTPLGTGDSTRAEANVLAEYGGTRITTQELQRNIQARFRNSSVGYDSQLVASMAGPLLDDLVLRLALEAEAKKLGLQVSDRELLNAVQSIPWLNQNGSFIGMDRYQDLIQQQTGMNISEFEAQLRESILVDKMRGVVTDVLAVSPAEVREEFLHRNAKVKIEYVLFDPGQFLKGVEVTPQVLEAFLKKSPERYKVPEQRRVRYALIDADSVKDQAKLSDEELRQYYSEHLSDYRVQDRVKVAHILFKTTGKKPDEIATLEKTARDVLAQARSGADFAQLAKKYSEDTTASNGGELGWVVRGQTVKEFEDAAFSMKPGELSDLIKTTYGFHILKLLDKQTAHQQTLEEVKESIRVGLEKQKLDAAEQALAEKLDRQLQASPKDFDSIVRKAGLEPRQTPTFKLDETLPDFGKSEAFQSLAFQLRPFDVGTPITVPKGVAVIQVTEIVPGHSAKLEEVRGRVEEDYRLEQSKSLAAEKAKAFAREVKTGDFARAAKAAGYTVKESKDFTQQDYVEGLGSGAQLSEAFSLPSGQVSDVVSLGATSVVFRVASHTPANEADLAAQQDRISEELLERKRSLAFEIYRQNLKEQLVRSRELKMNDAAMQQFLASYQKP